MTRDEQVERVAEAMRVVDRQFWSDINYNLENIPDGQYIAHMKQHEVNKAKAAIAAMQPVLFERINGMIYEIQNVLTYSEESIHRQDGGREACRWILESLQEMVDAQG